MSFYSALSDRSGEDSSEDQLELEALLYNQIHHGSCVDSQLNTISADFIVNDITPSETQVTFSPSIEPLVVSTQPTIKIDKKKKPIKKKEKSKMSKNKTPVSSSESEDDNEDSNSGLLPFEITSKSKFLKIVGNKTNSIKNYKKSPNKLEKFLSSSSDRRISDEIFKKDKISFQDVEGKRKKLGKIAAAVMKRKPPVQIRRTPRSARVVEEHSDTNTDYSDSSSSDESTSPQSTQGSVFKKKTMSTAKKVKDDKNKEVEKNENKEEKNTIEKIEYKKEKAKNNKNIKEDEDIDTVVEIDNSQNVENKKNKEIKENKNKKYADDGRHKKYENDDRNKKCEDDDRNIIENNTTKKVEKKKTKEVKDNKNKKCEDDERNIVENNKSKMVEKKKKKEVKENEKKKVIDDKNKDLVDKNKNLDDKNLKDIEDEKEDMEYEDQIIIEDENEGYSDNEVEEVIDVSDDIVDLESVVDVESSTDEETDSSSSSDEIDLTDNMPLLETNLDQEKLVSLEKLPQLSPDERDKWLINDKDRLSINTIHSRYFSPKTLKCRNCDQVGHFSRSCPEPLQKRCLYCGKKGHVFFACPQSICRNCFAPGHKANQCTSPWRSRDNVCNRCDMPGHVNKDCPDRWRQYHITTVFPDDELNKSSEENKRTFCYNCGKSGHWGHECEETRFNEKSQPSFPFIAYYDDRSLLRRAKRARENEFDRSNQRENRLSVRENADNFRQSSRPREIFDEEPRERKRRKIANAPCSDRYSDEEYHYPQTTQYLNRERYNTQDARKQGKTHKKYKDHHDSVYSSQTDQEYSRFSGFPNQSSFHSYSNRRRSQESNRLDLDLHLTVSGNRIRDFENNETSVGYDYYDHRTKKRKFNRRKEKSRISRVDSNTNRNRYSSKSDRNLSTKQNGNRGFQVHDLRFAGRKNAIDDYEDMSSLNYQVNSNEWWKNTKGKKRYR